jgi:pyruvate oxidase
MGYGIPGGIAAKLSFPERQVFTLSGDGAFAMVMQDILTQVKYRLPVINVVFSNASLGFIDAEQEDTRQPKYGVELLDMDFAKAAEAMGAKGYRVTTRQELIKAFDEVKDIKMPVVIDVKISNERPFPAEKMELDDETFIKRYEVKGMPTLKDLLK